MSKNKEKEKILKEINELFEKSPSQKEIITVRKKAMRINLKLPKEIKRKFCRKCNSILRGKVRLNKGKRVILCSECGKFNRIKYKN